MTDSPNSNRVAKLDGLIDSLKPFSNLQERSEVYVGPIPEIADFAITLYSTLANAIDPNATRVHEIQDVTFRRHITFANRSIIVALVSSIEYFMQSYCQRSHIQVHPLYVRKAKKLLDRCDPYLGVELRSWVKSMAAGGNATISDYSEAMLSAKNATDILKRDWRSFISIITVLRNKGAHGGAELATSDLTKIRAVRNEYDFEGELGYALSEGGELGVPLSFLPWALRKLQALADELDGHIG